MLGRSQHSMLGKKGFTLIEILVAIAIVGILASIAVVNFGKNVDQDVRMERERLTGFLRDVQNKALTGEIVTVSGTAVSGMCGFGFHYVSSSQIQAYYVANSNCAGVSKNYGTSLSSDVFYLKNGVTMTSTFDDTDDTFFLIPNGQVYKNNALMAGSNTTDIGLTKGTVTIDPAVTVDGAGNIKNVN
jgi:prepilin-type N-terminal cleavage/methylation domain-containing protein